MKRSAGVVLTVLALCVLWPHAVAAQSPSGEQSSAPLQLGPLSFTPSATLSAEYEDNVFNSPDDPKSDVSTTFLPQVKTSVQLSRLRIEADVALPFVRFARYRTEEQAGTNSTGQVTLPFNRLTLFVSGGYQNLKQRQSLEIDARVPRITKTVGVGSTLRVSSRLGLEMAAERQRTGYQDAVVDGVALNNSLAQRQDSVTLGVKRAVTPLTDLVVSLEARQDRFDTSGVRNADSQRVVASVTSTALLNGSGSVGYVRFQPLSSEVPPFRGLVADASWGYLFWSSTLVGVSVNRDVAFSYQAQQPYYVTTSTGVSLSRALLGVVVQARAGVQRLEYRALAGSGIPAEIDSGTTYSLGVLHRLSRHISLGGSATVDSRRSGGVRPSYTNRRILTSVAYAF